MMNLKLVLILILEQRLKIYHKCKLKLSNSKSALHAKKIMLFFNFFLANIFHVTLASKLVRLI